MDRNDKKLFSLGPVEMFDETLEVGSYRLPYFRTEEFSQVNLNIARLLKKFAYTDKSSEVAILTASGSGAMEAAVINTFSKKDKLLVVNGGSFGNRFCKICDIHSIPYCELKLKTGETLKKEHLKEFSNSGFTGLLINAHETSTCTYHDLELAGAFCKQENMTFIVDAISSFLADEYYMDKWGIDITILSSQKALAVSPGLSFLIVNKATVQKIKENEVASLYFDLKECFKDMERGQTPFTPAVGILLQVNDRLEAIDNMGLKKLIEDTRVLAQDFRKKIVNLPFSIPSEKLSNAATPLMPLNDISAYDVFTRLKDEFDIIVCPNGGNLKDKLFRVGHMGNLKIEDNDRLIEALKKIV